MQILPINNISNQIQGNRNRYCPNFKHHVDFLKLEQDYEILASNYFRRGPYYNKPSEEFTDVINTLKLFFSRKMKNQVSMLIGGVAESQEPYSMLAVIKSMIGKKKIKKALDLYTIDLQSKPDEKKLFLQSFYDERWRPYYVPESFEIEKTLQYGYGKQYKYKVKPDIYKYLSSVYNNPEKSQWERRIQEGIKEYPDEKFDIISVNNTIGYIQNQDIEMNVLKHILRIMKPGGVFITDPHNRYFCKVFSPDVCNEIYPGIYKKKKGNIDIKMSDNKFNERFIINLDDGINIFINLV